MDSLDGPALPVVHDLHPYREAAARANREVGAADHGKEDRSSAPRARDGAKIPGRDVVWQLSP